MRFEFNHQIKIKIKIEIEIKISIVMKSDNHRLRMKPSPWCKRSIGNHQLGFCFPIHANHKTLAGYLTWDRLKLMAQSHGNKQNWQLSANLYYYCCWAIDKPFGHTLQRFWLPFPFWKVAVVLLAFSLTRLFYFGFGFPDYSQSRLQSNLAFTC